MDDRPTPQTDDNVDHHLDNCDPNSPGANCAKISTNPYYYPYDRPRPLPRDRDLEQDQRTLRVNGPYNETQSAQWGRITLRQDLTVFVPNWFGQHDMKFGGIVEREHYNRDDSLRPYVFPNAQPAGSASINPTVGVQLPAENEVFNSANDTTFGMYVNDTYKPLPNLTLTLGVRFDRETTDSFGYTHFDPRAQRATFDKLSTLSGWERTLTDNTTGNNDGVTSQGYCADPIFFGLGGGQDACKSNSTGNQMLSDLNALRRIAQSRLTQHHIETSLAGTSLAQLFPDVQKDANGNLIFDRDLLRRQGFATFQEREPFRLTNNNLAPRFSLSWDPWGDSKTKVFANWSRFFDKLFLQTVTQEEGPDSIFRYYNADKDGVSGTGVPDNGFGAVITRAPPSATQVDRGLQTPFTDELSLGFERELAPEVSLKITYINRKFRQQLQDRDINHATRCCDPTTGRPFDVFGRINTGGGNQSGTAGQPVADFKPDLYIYNFFFNQVFRIGNFNHSRYHGIEVEVTKRLSRKWQLESSYTYSRARGNAESFQSFLGDDPATLHEEFGYLDFDMRHEVKFNAVTYLPGDWQLGSTLSWHSGLPYTVISTYLALDNFEYPQFRTLFGSIHRIPPGQPDPTNAGYAFFPERRNSRRNAAVYNINVEARKAFVLGKLNSKLFLTVENLLNTDDLEITYYEPAAPDRGGALQLISERRFGRRFEIGFQFEF